MKENLYDLASNIVYEVSNREKSEIELTLSKESNFCRVIFGDITQITIPKPKQIDGKYLFQGILFDTIEKSHHTLWSLFLASLYHCGGHAAVTDYSIYDKWQNAKSPTLAHQSIKFLEDLRVNEYLKSHYSNPSNNIELLNFACKLLYQKYLKHILESNDKFIFQKLFKNKIHNFKQEIAKQLSKDDSPESRIKLVDHIYHNRYFLDMWEYPYKENIKPTNFTRYLKYLNFSPKGEFKQYSEKIGDMFFDEVKKEEKILKKYEKYSEDLHFDRIILSPENLGKYFQVRMDSSNLIKKIRNQVKQVTNTVEDPNTEDYGYIEMQKAIQAVSSQTQGISYFEQDQELRYEESWAIVMDTSASMKIQFHELQKFLICIAEAADQINFRGGKWSIHGFNNDFVLIKDFKEKYNEHIRARIGGLNNSGLSFIPDAMKLATRMLEDDVNERRYLFLITDGYSMGYNEIDQEFQSAVKLAARAGINVIAIGVPDGMSKYFSISFPHLEVRKTVSKFIAAYTSLAQQMM